MVSSSRNAYMALQYIMLHTIYSLFINLILTKLTFLCLVVEIEGIFQGVSPNSYFYMDHIESKRTYLILIWKRFAKEITQIYMRLKYFISTTTFQGRVARIVVFILD